MKHANIKKLDTLKVFELLEEVKQALNDTEDPDELYFLNRYKKEIRRRLYDCQNCSKAKVSTNIDKYGEETERILSDCGEDCEFHDEFLKMAQEVEETDDNFADFFDNFR